MYHLLLKEIIIKPPMFLESKLLIIEQEAEGFLKHDDKEQLGD